MKGNLRGGSIIVAQGQNVHEIKPSNREPILGWLEANLEGDDDEDKDKDEQAPVRADLRYIDNRREHFFYEQAINLGLPIGSEMTEGGRRHELHPKPKVAGAWNPDKDRDTAQFRFSRTNGRPGASNTRSGQKKHTRVDPSLLEFVEYFDQSTRNLLG